MLHASCPARPCPSGRLRVRQLRRHRTRRRPPTCTQQMPCTSTLPAA